MPRGGSRPGAGRRPKNDEKPKAETKTRVASPAKTPVIPAVPAELSPREVLFVDAYCGPANFVASEAYRLAGFKAKSESGLRGSASQLLAKPIVQEAIAVRLLDRRRVLLSVADDDECLERVTKRARADIGKVLGPDDPLSQLPDDVRLGIKAVRPSRYGRTIELYDTHREDELLLKVSGRLRERHEHRISRSLEDILSESNQPAEASA